MGQAKGADPKGKNEVGVAREGFSDFSCVSCPEIG
jgi:hypothetical protein